MPRPLILLITFSLFSANLHAEDAKKPSPAVKRVLDKAVADVKKNRQEFDKANQKPLEEARTELADLSTMLIKDGKTDEAAAVLAQLKTLDADVMRMTNVPPMVPAARGTTPLQKPLLEMLVGEWRRGGNNDVFVITPNGSCQISNGDQGTLTVTSPEVAEVVLKSGWRLTILLAREDIACSLEWDPQGHQTPGFVLERIK